MENTNKRRAVVYCRVSTEEQATEGISLEAQRSELEAYCAAAGLEVAEVVQDAGVSGSKALAAREGGQRLLDLLKDGKATAVVAFKLDRLFRSAANSLDVVEAWTRKDVALHVKDLGGQAVDTTSASGKVFLGMLSVFAQFERDQTAERVHAALAAKRARNEFCGGRVPYGFRLASDGKSLEINEHEQEGARVAVDLHSSGLSLRKVGAELLRRGFAPRASAQWGASAVRAMVRRELEVAS